MFRKIRCCGGAPCRNCARSNRECDYTPVPEEVNRATREKKAVAKASKTTPSPVPSFSPFFGETPVFDVPHTSTRLPAHMSHRRSVSVPNFEMSHWIPPPAPSLQSPAMFESAQWMYNGWSSAPAIPIPEEHTPTRTFPSVLEQTPTHDAYLSQWGPATPTDSRSSSTESDPPFHPSWSAPNITSSYLRPPMPLTPLQLQPNAPYPTPPLFLNHAYSPSPLAHSTSPTLAPDISHKDLVGLGIGPNEEAYRSPTFIPEEYFASPRF